MLVENKNEDDILFTFREPSYFLSFFGYGINFDRTIMAEEKKDEKTNTKNYR